MTNKNRSIEDGTMTVGLCVISVQYKRYWSECAEKMSVVGEESSWTKAGSLRNTGWQQCLTGCSNECLGAVERTTPVTDQRLRTELGGGKAEWSYLRYQTRNWGRAVKESQHDLDFLSLSQIISPLTPYFHFFPRTAFTDYHPDCFLWATRFLFLFFLYFSFLVPCARLRWASRK